jgi:hypothetical protein
VHLAELAELAQQAKVDPVEAYLSATALLLPVGNEGGPTLIFLKMVV